MASSCVLSSLNKIPILNLLIAFPRHSRPQYYKLRCIHRCLQICLPVFGQTWSHVKNGRLLIKNIGVMYHIIYEWVNSKDCTDDF